MGCAEERCCWDVLALFDQEVSLRPTLQPQWSQQPDVMLQQAFEVTNDVGTSFDVLDVRVCSPHISMKTCTNRQGVNLDSCKLSYGYGRGVWPAMPLTGVSLPMAQFKVP